jgi:hypothetical protein
MNRRDFLLSGCAHLLVCAALPPLLVSETRAEVHRGGRVGWARLKTPADHWQRHTTSDSTLSEFIRENTTLNMDPEWKAADCTKLDELCAFPLVFSTSLVPVVDPASVGNLAEYLRRGGFLFVDSCINKDINPDPDRFLRENSEVFRRLLPGCEIRRLPDDHEIYACYFRPAARPPHTYYNNIYDKRWADHGLYGVFVGARLASLISLSGLQCGWDRMIAPPGHPEECMKMVVNIYVTAMTA